MGRVDPKLHRRAYAENDDTDLGDQTGDRGWYNNPQWLTGLKTPTN